MDMFSGLSSSFAINAQVFHTGELCGVADFSDDHGVGHLHIVRHGRATVFHPDRAAIEIETPSVLFYPRALSHRLVVPDAGAADVLCATISFAGGTLNPLARSLPDSLLVPLDSVATLAATLDVLYQEAGADAYGRQVILDRLCEVLIVQLLRYAVSSELIGHGALAGASNIFLARALSALHARPGQAWSIASLADEAGMSRSAFSRLFHDVIGVTPAAYLADCRIVAAQRLLDEDRPVGTVALEVGYGSQPAFTKAFTRRVGMSPREWRKRSGSD